MSWFAGSFRGGKARHQSPATGVVRRAISPAEVGLPRLVAADNHTHNLNTWLVDGQTHHGRNEGRNVKGRCMRSRLADTSHSNEIPNLKCSLEQEQTQ